MKIHHFLFGTILLIAWNTVPNIQATTNVYYLDDYCFDVDDTDDGGGENILQRSTRNVREVLEDFEWELKNQFSGELAVNSEQFKKLRKKWEDYVEKSKAKLEKKAEKYQKKFDEWKVEQEHKAMLKHQLKQIVLDSTVQPSVVLKTCGEGYSFHHHEPTCRLAKKNKHQKCYVLIRMSQKDAKESFGTSVNFAKFKLRFVKSTNCCILIHSMVLSDPNDTNSLDTLRIVSSDPNMTNYIINGKRIMPTFKLDSNDTDPNQVVNEMKQFIEQNVIEKLETTFDTHSKWIFVELEKFELNLTDREKRNVNAHSPDRAESEEQMEMVINLFQSDSKQDDVHECPSDTFDCFLDGTQCIDESLRQIDLFFKFQSK